MFSPITCKAIWQPTHQLNQPQAREKLQAGLVLGNYIIDQYNSYLLQLNMDGGFKMVYEKNVGTPSS